MKVRFSEHVAVGETDAVSTASNPCSQRWVRTGLAVELSLQCGCSSTTPVSGQRYRGAAEGAHNFGWVSS